ncbi:MAG TPA: hypothetical protein VK978_01085 [Candidatus Saccharimonadales bacterium]|nr:hypothetical protein [Candidatus Saccharimonadales bacterium]
MSHSESSPISGSDFVQQPHESVPEPFEYKLLTGHARTDGTWKNDAELRTEYIRNTDELIRQAVEGVRFTDHETGESSTERPDAIIFLDKSARPVQWLMNEMWDEHAADAEGNVPEKPDSYFLNIDREQWVNTLDPQGAGVMDIEKVDPTIIRSLRSIFVSPEKKKEGLTESIDEAPSVLDHKRILIVDEVQTSGRTLTYAMNFLRKAIPTAKVAGTYWMGSVTQKGTAVANADLPVWYKEKSERGRGVGNRNERASQNSHSRTQRLGGWFLSTTFKEPDPASVQLRKELAYLAHDPDVLVAPSIKRDEDDQDERIARFNNGMTLKEFIQQKRAQSEQNK